MANEMEYMPVLSHSDVEIIFNDWKERGSLREAVKHQLESGALSHTVYNHDEDGDTTTEQTYGMADIDYLFPDAKNVFDDPYLISRQMDWVKKVLNGTRHTPFANVKSIFADVTMDEARAKGYVKGNQKTEEVFALLKRKTAPQTIYKKQKLDRDDVVDITDFNVVYWLKAEMRMMLEEEVARAMLLGDGRANSSPDKISESHIRPIATDNPLYTIRSVVSKGETNAETAKSIIRASLLSRKDYRGSGNTVMFTSPTWHMEMNLLEDEYGRPMYETEKELCDKLRVNEIIDVEAMENSGSGKEIAAVIVDLRDYNVGTNKGGAVNLFDDFDIDYNRQIYLMETRLSGALVKPFSAIAIEVADSSANVTMSAKGGEMTVTESDDPNGGKVVTVGWNDTSSSLGEMTVTESTDEHGGTVVEVYGNTSYTP